MTDSTEQTRCGQGDCLCAGTGPAASAVVSEMLKRFGPSDSVRQHFSQARVEILKGLRAIIDQRIHDIQKPATARGAKVNVE